MDTAKGAPARHLFRCAGDSNLDASQAEGPEPFVYYSGGIPQQVCAAGSVRLEGSHREADLLTKTPGGHSCTH